MEKRANCAECHFDTVPAHETGTADRAELTRHTVSELTVSVESGARGGPRRGRNALSTQKCTESVAPSSGDPTDVRRSDCLSESHQPRALRARCNRNHRPPDGARQG